MGFFVTLKNRKTLWYIKIVMRLEDEKFLWNIIKEREIGFPFKRIAQNPLENSYWGSLLNGALTALNVVAIGSLDWKLAAIVKLFQSWLKDKEEEKEELRRKTELGYNYQQVGVGSFDSIEEHVYY